MDISETNNANYIFVQSTFHLIDDKRFVLDVSLYAGGVKYFFIFYHYFIFILTVLYVFAEQSL